MGYDYLIHCSVPILEWTFAMDTVLLIIEAVVKNLTSIVTALASIWIAVVATRALQTWKHQTRAEKNIHFMDELTDIVHEYIQAMSAPIQLLHYVEIAVESYSKVAAIRPDKSDNSGIITYIQERGKDDQGRLCEYLDKVRPIASRLASLSAKGQVMGFENSRQCFEACKMLLGSLKQIESVTILIGNPNYNWENELVQQTLDEVMSVKSQPINENLEKHHGMLLEFMRHNYEQLFK